MGKPKVGQAVVFRGAVATVWDVGPACRNEDGTRHYRWLTLDTHKGREQVTTDHAELHIP